MQYILYINTSMFLQYACNSILYMYKSWYLCGCAGKTMGRRQDFSRNELHNVQVNLSTLHEGW